MNTQHPLLPSEWNDLAPEMASFSLINSDTAALLTCAAFAAACGSGIQIRTPEFRDIAPSFNLGLVSSGFPMPRGALKFLLGPMDEMVQLTKTQKELVGLEGLNACCEIFRRDMKKLDDNLQMEKRDLVDACSDEGRTARMMASGSSYSSRASAHPDAIRARIHEITQRQAVLQADIDSFSFKQSPGILVNEPEWREMPKLSEGSFDRNVVALSFDRWPGQILNLTAKERNACARTLNCYADQGALVTVITATDELTYAYLLRNKAIRESGILSGFLFMDVSNGAPETPSLINAAGSLKRWHDLIAKRCEARTASQKMECRLYQPDADGFRAYVELRKWVETEKSFTRPEVAPFLSLLPDLCLKLALIRTAMSGATKSLLILGEIVEQCAEFLRRVGRQQRELLERLVVDQPDEEVIAQEVGRLVQKLERRGPLTKRGLARCMHNQDYSRLEPILEHGLRHGDIRQDGELFSAPIVSVSASA